MIKVIMMHSELKLNSVNWTEIINGDNLDTTAETIAEAIINSASETIPE